MLICHRTQTAIHIHTHTRDPEHRATYFVTSHKFLVHPQIAWFLANKFYPIALACPNLQVHFVSNAKTVAAAHAKLCSNRPPPPHLLLTSSAYKHITHTHTHTLTYARRVAQNTQIKIIQIYFSHVFATTHTVCGLGETA